ncbi:MAG: hypothetical protein R2705_19945 [Ilumatobacteraceae bacterium]
MTRDNILEGDTGASASSPSVRVGGRPPSNLRIQVPADVGANLEGVVTRIDDDAAAGGAGHLWKLVRTFDDPRTWTEPHVRHLTESGPDGDRYRDEILPDEWELYDLDADPAEAHNRKRR